MKLKKNIAKNNNQNNKNQIWHKKLIASFFLIWREWGVETNERREKGERKRKKKGRRLYTGPLPITRTTSKKGTTKMI